MEELYTKFIEQRQLLAAQEKAELQAINTKQIEEHNSSSIKVG